MDSQRDVRDDSGDHESALSIAACLESSRQKLVDAGISDAAIEARTLIKHALDITQVELLTDSQRVVSSSELRRIEEAVSRRLTREPLQYITGETEFFGRTFKVDQRVLIPRPETELLVEQALAYLREHQVQRPEVLDIGTGSGILAVTLACEIDDAEVTATDISSDALAVAKVNTERHGVADRIRFLNCSLADEASGHFNVIVSNPPYVRSPFLDGSEVQPELSFEPRLALDGGEDGMDVYKPLLTAVSSLLPPSGAAFIEIDPPIAEKCLALAKSISPDADVEVLTDLAGLERCLVINTSL